jgi:hypothetical protein
LDITVNNYKLRFRKTSQKQNQCAEKKRKPRQFANTLLFKVLLFIARRKIRGESAVETKIFVC